MGSSCSIDKGDNAEVAKKETVEITSSTCEQHQQPQNHIHIHENCANQSRVHGSIKVHDATKETLSSTTLGSTPNQINRSSHAFEVFVDDNILSDVTTVPRRVDDEETEKCAAEDGTANPLKLRLCAATTTVAPSTSDENNYSCDESPQNIVHRNEWARRIHRTMKEEVTIVIHIPHTEHSGGDVALSSDDDAEEEECAKEDDASSPCYAPSNMEVIAPPPPRCRGSFSFSSTSSSSSSP